MTDRKTHTQTQPFIVQDGSRHTSSWLLGLLSEQKSHLGSKCDHALYHCLIVTLYIYVQNTCVSVSCKYIESKIWKIIYRSMMISGAMLISVMELIAGLPVTGWFKHFDNFIFPLPNLSLLDSNLDDDCSCAKIIWNRHGFDAWYGWKNNCKGTDVESWVSDCF